MTPHQIKWLSLDNYDGTASLKQHGFVPKVCKMPYTREEYNGNISLCRKVWCSEDGETGQDHAQMDSEPLNIDRACKLCLKRL